MNNRRSIKLASRISIKYRSVASNINRLCVAGGIRYPLSTLHIKQHMAEHLCFIVQFVALNLGNVGVLHVLSMINNNT